MTLHGLWYRHRLPCIYVDFWGHSHHLALIREISVSSVMNNVSLVKKDGFPKLIDVLGRFIIQEKTLSFLSFSELFTWSAAKNLISFQPRGPVNLKLSTNIFSCIDGVEKYISFTPALLSVAAKIEVGPFRYKRLIILIFVTNDTLRCETGAVLSRYISSFF